MFLIKTPSCGRAHELAIQKIVRYGIPVMTEDHEQTLELPEELNITITDPLGPPRYSPGSLLKQNYLDEYTDNLMNGTDKEFAYTYHDQLFKYGSNSGIVPGLDQISTCIDILKNNPASRRAQAITYEPNLHLTSPTPPCLQRIQFTIRPLDTPRLNAYVQFRSNDMLSAFGANIYALTSLQKHVADALDIDMGIYSHTITVPHIYHVRDAFELSRMKSIYE